MSKEGKIHTSTTGPDIRRQTEHAVGMRPLRAGDFTTKFELDQEVVETYFRHFGTRTDIPKNYLWGRQRPQAYTRSPEYRVKVAFSQMGTEFLKTKPVLTVIVPRESSNDSKLILVDGHHRSRFAPAFGINSIPSLVTDIEKLAEWVNGDPGALATELNTTAQDAFDAFRLRQAVKEKGSNYDALQTFTIPEPLTLPAGIRPIELPDYFRQQNQQPIHPLIMQPNVQYSIHQRR